MAAHLEYLQTVLWEFDADAVISEPVFIRLFCNGLKPSIHAQAKQKDRQKDNKDQAIKKAITAEAKVALNLSSWVSEIDACCPQDYRSALKSTKDHTWDQGSFLFRPQEAQIMPLDCFKQAETLKKPQQDYQKGRHDKNYRNCGLHGFRSQGSILATVVNTTKTLARNDHSRNQPARQKDRNLSWTTC